MNNSKKFSIFISIVLIYGCNSSISFFQGDSLEAIQNNLWTWNVDGYSCEIAVQEINLVDTDTLEFTWFDVKKGVIDNSHQSKIRKTEGGYIELMPKLDEETNKPKPFYWTLVVKSNTEICWRRSDWNPLLCTNTLKSCGQSKKQESKEDWAKQGSAM